MPKPAQRHSLLKSVTELGRCSCRAGANIPDCLDENAHRSVSLAKDLWCEFDFKGFMGLLGDFIQWAPWDHGFFARSL